MTGPTRTTLHRALGDERRARIVRELETAHEAVDASELGRRVGLHANTVRFHLGVLADAGLVRSGPAPRQTPGRPRVVYELAADVPVVRGDEYRLLATVLAQLVSRGPNGVSACEEAGRAWGRDLVRQPTPATAMGDEGAIDGVVELLAEQGFEPSSDGLAIEMRRCPFQDLAETYPAIVCGLHRGLIDGALAARGSRLRVGELEIFPRPNLCVARLAAAR